MKMSSKEPFILQKEILKKNIKFKASKFIIGFLLLLSIFVLIEVGNDVLNNESKSNASIENFNALDGNFCGVKIKYLFRF